MRQIIWGGYGVYHWSARKIERDAAVCVEGTRIIDTGTRDELRALHPDAALFGGDELFLMPAFVNAHDHGRCIGSLSLGVPDTFLELWLPTLALQPALPKETAAAYEGIHLLKSGVTATAHSHNPNAWETLAEEAHQTIAGYRRVGMRVAFHPPIIDQNALIYADRDRFLPALPADLTDLARSLMGNGAPYPVDDYFALCESLYRQYHDRDGAAVQIQVSPAGGQWCSDALITRCADFAAAHRTRIQMHLLETRYQQIYAQKTWAKSFIQHLNDLGVLSHRLTLAHMVYVDDPADFDLIGRHDVGIAHNPSSNLRLRSGIAPIDRLYLITDVGIGLDGQSLDEDQDYWRELRLAWTLANRPGMGAASTGLDAWHVLDSGTTSGSTITFTTALHGQLAKQHLADLILLDWKAAVGFWTPDVDYAVAFPDVLLRRANRTHVKHVMSDGEWVIRDGQSTKADESALAAELRDALARTDRAALRQSAARLRRLLPYIRDFYAAWG